MTPLILILLLSQPTFAADIYIAKSVPEIHNTWNELVETRNPAKTLTIMPLERFLLKPVAPEFHTKDPALRSVFSRVMDKVKLSKEAYADEVVLTEYDNALGEAGLVDFFKDMQAKNAPFIVVTRNVSGSFNDIDYLEVWTHNYLQEKGIDLTKNLLGSHQIIFNIGYDKVKGTYPTFYRGLLSCNSEDDKNSPQSLIASLLAVNLKWMPDIVYVIDTSEGYIKSLESQFRAISGDVQVVGFVYEPTKPVYAEINPDVYLKFWNGVIDRVNKVSRREAGKREDPYEQ